MFRNIRSSIRRQFAPQERTGKQEVYEWLEETHQEYKELKAKIKKCSEDELNDYSWRVYDELTHAQNLNYLYD